MTLFTDFMVAATVILLSTICVTIYMLRKRYNYWRNRNVPFVSKLFSDPILCLRETHCVWFENIYKTFDGHPYVGFYGFGKPSLIIRDPKLVQHILIKDFAHFPHRPMTVNEIRNPLYAVLFFMKGERAKKIRAKLTESFSSGRLKAMYPLLEECVSVCDKNLEESLTRSAEVDAQFFFSKFAVDVIGACAFGQNFNAMKDDDSGFRRIADKIVISKFRHVAKLALGAIHPKLVYWFKRMTSEQEIEEFFFSLTRETMEHREQNEHKRKDFMQLLINKQKEEQKLLESQSGESELLFTETVITANVFLFFTAGYKTIASALAFCTYELALNPLAMGKVYQEIIRVKNAHNGVIDYAALKEMTYMENVIYETLRLYPTAPHTSRECTKAYKVPDSSLVIEKNTKVLIPICSLQLDPKHFLEPKKFDPDRFNEENRAKIIPGSYLPFGDGPRKCIAVQFAMMEMKAALASIFGKYAVYPTEKTEIPITMTPNEFSSVALNGIHLRFEKRKK